MAVRITDLVDPEAIQKLKDLDAELRRALDTYTKVAKDLAQGLNIEVKVSGDIDKLEKLLIEKGNEAAQVQEHLTQVIQQQGQAIANTTPTISRRLMEQERVNKLTRETYTEQEKVKQLLERYHDTYEAQIQSMIRINQQLEDNKRQQKENEQALKAGRMSAEGYSKAQAQLMASTRSLTQQKRALNAIMTAEEKMSMATEGSYAQLSQQLELLKKAYKEMCVETKESDFGREMETAIQNLDAHLKDLAADMGEFQRNVGNYAIAGRNGIVSTESLMAVLDQMPTTTRDIIDQTKILTDAREMLDQTDANYEDNLSHINARLAENKRKLADVSDIMDVHASSVAEAEAQNQRLTEALKNVDLNSEDAAETTAALNAKIQENNKIISDNTVSQQTLKKDLRDLVLEIATLSIEYQNLSKEEQQSAEGQALKAHIDGLIEKAGELKDAIADTNQAITNAASDTRTFDQMSGGIQLAIDGFGLATGAAQMLGISTEDLASIQTKLQAAIAASNAMQSIQNTLQAQSAVMQGVNLLQTNLRTAAENMHTAAQGKGTIATAALTAAQWAFNAAANANPIGLIVVIIVAAIAAVWGLVKAFEAFFGVSDEALKHYADQKQALEDLCEANDKLIDRMKARGATEAELTTQSLKNKQAEKEAADALFAAASELYDDDEDEYKEALEAKKKADEDFETSKEDGLNYLLKIQAEVNAYEREQAIGTLAYKLEIIEAEKKKQLELAELMYLNGELTRKQYEDIVASVNKYAQIKSDKAKENDNKRVSGRSGNDAKKQAEELKKQVRAGEDALLKIVTDSLERQRKEEQLSYSRKLKDLKEKLAKTKDTEVEMRKAINRQIEGLTAEHNQKMAQLEMEGNERRNKAEAEVINSHLDIVESGSEEELQWKLKSLSNQHNAELLALQKSEDDKTLTAEQAEEIRINLAEKYAALREDAEEEHANKAVEAIQKRYAKEQSEADNAYIEQVAALKKRYAQELTEAGDNAAKQTVIKEKYEQDLADIDEQYARQTVQQSISMLEEVLKTEKLSDDERLKYAEELAKKKAEFEKMTSDAAVEGAQQTVEAEAKAKEKRIANVKQWMQVAADSLNAINDLMGAVYDAKIQKIEEDQEAQEAAGDAEQERISELVEKKVISEEEGEARKRAAEAKTAKKNEELEKKKAKLKHKQAVWDKANSIAQAGIATALAITEALPNVVLAAIAGAMGAIQIATILATPIPKYAKGTDYHKGGPAIVGDGGVQEVITYRGQSWLTPDTPTLVDIPAGASVIPKVEEVDLSELALIGSVPTVDKGYTPYNDSRVIDRLDDLISLERRNAKISRQRSVDSELARYIAKNGL